jgi:hypothetical protein
LSCPRLGKYLDLVKFLTPQQRFVYLTDLRVIGPQQV